MTETKETDPLKVGDWVKIRHSGFGAARVVEFWGPLGPGGALVYRVRIKRKPRSIFIDLCEDQLERVLADGSN